MVKSPESNKAHLFLQKNSSRPVGIVDFPHFQLFPSHRTTINLFLVSTKQLLHPFWSISCFKALKLLQKTNNFSSVAAIPFDERPSMYYNIKVVLYVVLS